MISKSKTGAKLGQNFFLPKKYRKKFKIHFIRPKKWVGFYGFVASSAISFITFDW